jgi:hypothetical protein
MFDLRLISEPIWSDERKGGAGAGTFEAAMTRGILVLTIPGRKRRRSDQRNSTWTRLFSRRRSLMSWEGSSI